MKRKEAFIGLRLSREEVKKLDRHAQGQLSRSQIVRILIQEFLDKPEVDQREILFKRLFGQ